MTLNEEEAKALKMKAITNILATEPSRYGELTRQETDESELIILFDRLTPYEQIRAYQGAGVRLNDLEYGFPSDATVAKFGKDGTMRSPASIVGNDGDTYES